MYAGSDIELDLGQQEIEGNDVASIDDVLELGPGNF